MTHTKQQKSNLRSGEILAYRGSQEEDLAILKWYLELNASGELQDFVTEDINTPFAFLKMCQQPNVFLFTVDDSYTIIHASLFFPFMTATAVSVWTAPHIRGTRGHLIYTQKILEAATKTRKVIIALTKHPHLIGLFEKVGCVRLGDIPYILDNQPATLLYLTKALYESTDFSKLGGK